MVSSSFVKLCGVAFAFVVCLLMSQVSSAAFRSHYLTPKTAATTSTMTDTTPSNTRRLWRLLETLDVSPEDVRSDVRYNVIMNMEGF
jgi:hypothetical protein